MTFLYVLLVAILAVSGYGAWVMTRKTSGADSGDLIGENATLKSQLQQHMEELGKRESELGKERSQKDEWKGKYAELFAADTNLKSDFKILSKERDGLKKRVAEFEAEEKRREKELETKVMQLTKVEEALKQERQRVVREDEEKRALELEERDRMWAEHELSVISLLTDLCKQPQFAFTGFTNTDRPEGFDVSLKPDFMIDFLHQYVIFDAKVSKAKSLQAYIDDQVKRTVEKVKGNDKIYKWIFLVVPSGAIAELRHHQYIVEGFNIFVIAPESIPAILACLKHITRYEFAEQMDPEERENIVQLIAELDFHINLRNAADVLLTRMGTDILQRTQQLNPDLAEEVAIKKQPMNAKASLAAQEIKKIVSNLALQNEEVQRLTSPKAAVRKKDLEAASAMLFE